MTAVAAPPSRPSAPNRSQPQVARARFRRALTLLAMTLLLPGSAQLVAGNKRWGRVAVRVLGSLLACLLVLVVVGKLWPQAVAALVFDPAALTVLRLLLLLCAFGWVLLFVDAWRLGQPLGLQRRQRFGLFALNLVLCVSVLATLSFGAHLVSVHRSLVVDMFGAGTVSATEDGRYNVLLLGADAGTSRDGLRPDSITLASIDEESGRTVLFGLPRNMEKVPFPEDSPMHARFPDGFDCEGCYLNAVYTWAHDHADLFPDDIPDVGAYATKEAVEAITGLTVNYQVMVDLRGFRELVDAVGGVTLTVPERLPIGRLGGPVRGWIEPGRQHLDGYQALWFARSRATSDDYSRMGRQKCVLNAMLEQLDPRTALTRFQEIAAASRQVATTDIPASEIPTFLRLAQRAKRLPMSSVSFVPPRVQTFDPDYDRVHAMVEAAVDKAESADEGAPRGERTHVAAGGDRAAAPGSTAVTDVTDSGAGQPATGPAPEPAPRARARQTAHGTTSLADAC